MSFDPATQRVFVSHGDRVTVLDGREGTVLGQVEGFPGGTHGIGIVNAAGRGYTVTEHVGKQNLPAYFSFLLGKLTPGGRLLNHCITRPDNTEPAIRMRGFINRYVFPDGELEGPGYLISLMTDTGFEVRHEENLREHYAKTLAAWCANLDAHWDEAVQEVGQGTARVWRLYMAGSRLGFDRNHIELHQVLGVKLQPDGTSGMPLRPDWEIPRVLAQ